MCVRIHYFYLTLLLRMMVFYFEAIVPVTSATRVMRVTRVLLQTLFETFILM